MKLARLFLALATTSILAACGESATAPEAAPAGKPSMDGATSCPGGVITRTVNQDGTTTERCTGMSGSGG